MRIVTGWLRNIGLGYAIPKFKSAGIVTIDSLAALEVQHFDMLGIESDEDRRKLFFLVTSVKQKLSTQQQQQDQEEDLEEEGQDGDDDEQLQEEDGFGDGGGEDIVDDDDSDCHLLVPASPPSPATTTPSTGEEEEEEEFDNDDDELINHLVETTTASATEKKKGKKESPTAAAAVSQTLLPGPTTTSPDESSPRTQQKQQSTSTVNSAAASGSIVQPKPRRAQRLSGVPVPARTTRSGATNAATTPRRHSVAGAGTISAVPRSMRTGKVLKPVPANSQMPMSPLVELPPDPMAPAAAATAASKDGGDDYDDGNNAQDLHNGNNKKKSNRSLSLSNDRFANVTGRSTRRKSALRSRHSYSGGSTTSEDDDVYDDNEQNNVSVSSGRSSIGTRTTTIAPAAAAAAARNGGAGASGASSTLEQKLSKLAPTSPSRFGGGNVRSSSRSVSGSSIPGGRTTKRRNTANNKTDINNGRMSLSRSSSGRSLRSEPPNVSPKTRRTTAPQHQYRHSSSFNIRCHSNTNNNNSNNPRRSISCSSNRTRPSSRSPTRSPTTTSQRRQTTAAVTRNASLRTSTRRGGVGCSKQDNSHATQIARLRQHNDVEHASFYGGNSNNDGDTNDFDNTMRIRVVLRKRPISVQEEEKNEIDVVHPLDYGSYGRVLLYQPRETVDLTKRIETTPFAFDNVFGENVCNRELYERAVQPLVPDFLMGSWGSVFAYGQTGSGKTFTMLGSCVTTGGGSDGDNAINSSHNWGLYYLAGMEIFQIINTKLPHLSVRVSLFEIYADKLYDLLNDRKEVRCLENHDGRVCFPELTQHDISSAYKLLDCINVGMLKRSTGTTSRNADSSRSHAILQLHLYNNEDGDGGKEYSRLTFVDLAGSERGADTSSSSKTTQREGADINQSLLGLKEVIRAIATGDRVNFRMSKLTRVLKESFIGSNTGQAVMIACISPNNGNCEHTLNTLRYADRVKERNPENGRLLNSVANNNTNIQRRAAIAAAKNTSTVAPIRQQQAQTKGNARSLHVNTSTAATRATAGKEDDGNDDNMQAAPASLDVSTASNASALLDDILATPKAEANNGLSGGRQAAVYNLDHQNNDNINTTKRQAAAELIAEHKKAATSMLQMLEEEMMLVNGMGGEEDRISMDDYVFFMNDIHDRQLDIIMKLREHLLKYHEADSATNDGNDNNDEEGDDDSYEDLRD